MDTNLTDENSEVVHVECSEEMYSVLERISKKIGLSHEETLITALGFLIQNIQINGGDIHADYCPEVAAKVEKRLQEAPISRD